MLITVLIAASVAGAAQAQTICRGTVCGSSVLLSRSRGRIMAAGPGASCPTAFVVDGDTIHCGHPRIRLLGIDAPEIEHCPRYRVCAPGDGQASRRSLIAALRYGPVRFQPKAIDRFGRTVAVVWAGDVNLSCWQLQQGQAIYKPHWDTGGVIARACHL